MRTNKFAKLLLFICCTLTFAACDDENEIYFTQTYKLINGIEIEDDDLVFYFNKSELAKFLQPLIKVENINE